MVVVSSGKAAITAEGVRTMVLGAGETKVSSGRTSSTYVFMRHSEGHQQQAAGTGSKYRIVEACATAFGK